jgi:hypothetical protein
LHHGLNNHKEDIEKEAAALCMLLVNLLLIVINVVHATVTVQWWQQLVSQRCPMQREQSWQLASNSLGRAFPCRWVPQS